MKSIAICVLVSCLAFCSQGSGQDGVITTVAGNGSTVFCGVGSCAGDGGLGTSASLGSGGVAVDASGNLFIGDCLNNRVRRVSSSGVITTVAGNGNDGYPNGVLGDGGPATSGSLWCPQAVALDASGNLFIADSENHRIRKVSPGGIITTIAGNSPFGVNLGGFSGDGGPATGASLNYPEGLALDASGNLFIADSGNFRIRKVSPSGTITTVAGGGLCCFSGDGGLATSAAIGAQGVAVDGSGNLFIADSANRIRKVSPSGIITTVAGTGTAGFSGDGGPATSAALNGGADPYGVPIGVAVDASGNLLIVDSGNNRIRKVLSDGVITTVAGNGSVGFSGDGGLATEASLNLAIGGGIAIDAFGNLFIADENNDRIRRVSAQAAGASISVAPTQVNFSESQGQSGTFAQSIQLSGTTGATWYATTTTSTGGAWLSVSPGSGQIGESLAALVTSASLQLGTYQGSIVFQAPDATPSSITISVTLSITQGGVITTVAGGGSGGDGGPATSAHLSCPSGVALGASGNLLIVDTCANQIRKVSASGIITTVAGTGTAGFSGDGGPATLAMLNSPWSVAVDASENIFIADSENNRIRKVSANGIITTVAGTGTAGFSGDGGPATEAMLDLYVYGSGDNRTGIAVDASENLFIADNGNALIRKVSANGIITTVAGGGNSLYSVKGGSATSTMLFSPTGVAVDTSGNLFFADDISGTVQKMSASGIITIVAGNFSSCSFLPCGGFSGDGGRATSAELNGPTGVAVDASGNLFIADEGNNRIRRVSASGIITTVAGGGNANPGDGGPATLASLSGPEGVAINALGDIFIATSGYIREVFGSASPTLPAPLITSGGVVPLDSSVNTIQSGEWVSIYGTNLAGSAVTWNGNFPTSLGGTSVTVNGKAAYLSFVSPTQINLQAPNDTSTGSVPVVVTTAGGTATSSVTLAKFAPSFLLRDSTHVAGIILRSNGTGAYGGGAYDIIGPTGNSLGYPTVAAKAGDSIELFAVGLGPTSPTVPAGQSFSGAAPTTNPVNLLIHNVSVMPDFAGLSSAGVYQINLTVPPGLGTGDVSLQASVGGIQTPSGVVISLQ